MADTLTPDEVMSIALIQARKVAAKMGLPRDEWEDLASAGLEQVYRYGDDTIASHAHRGAWSGAMAYGKSRRFRGGTNGVGSIYWNEDAWDPAIMPEALELVAPLGHHWGPAANPDDTYPDLSCLTEAQRIAITAVVLEGRDAKHVAEEMGRSVSGLRQTIQRGLGRLRRRYEEAAA